MRSLPFVAMVVACAAAVVRHFPPQGQEYRPYPYDATNASTGTNGVLLVFAVMVAVLALSCALLLVIAPWSWLNLLGLLVVITALILLLEWGGGVERAEGRQR